MIQKLDATSRSSVIFCQWIIQRTKTVQRATGSLANDTSAVTYCKGNQTICILLYLWLQIHNCCLAHINHSCYQWVSDPVCYCITFARQLFLIVFPVFVFEEWQRGVDTWGVCIIPCALVCMYLCGFLLGSLISSPLPKTGRTARSINIGTQTQF